MHYFSVLPMMAAVGVDKLKFAVIGIDTLNNTMQIRAAGRAFNDPMARGSCTDLESAWDTPATGDFAYNTGEIDLSGLSLGSHQFVEFAAAVRKSADNDTNSRVLLTIYPSVLSSGTDLDTEGNPTTIHSRVVLIDTENSGTHAGYTDLTTIIETWPAIGAPPTGDYSGFFASCGWSRTLGWAAGMLPSGGAA